MAKWRDGDAATKRQAEALVYEQLRTLATTYMRRERRGHTLQATALVNEALVRVVGSRKRMEFIDEHHFYAVAARIMRHVLVDHAKAHRRQKRGGGNHEELLADNIGAPTTDGGINLAELDELLEKLAAVQADAAHVIELYYFAGLSQPEIAKVMDVSLSAVERRMRFAKAWLLPQLKNLQGK